MKIVAEVVNLILGFESPKLDLYKPSYGPFSGTTIGFPVLAEPTVQIFGTDFWLVKSENLTSISSRKLYLYLRT